LLAVATGVATGVVLGAVIQRTSTARKKRATKWPLPEWPPSVVQEWRTGERAIGAKREDHVHAGVDLGPPREGAKGRAYGSPVLSPVSGRVVKIDGGWRGEDAKQIQIESPVYGLIVLGAVQPKAAVVEGQMVAAGQLVGWLGQYPSGATMLHLEQHGIMVSPSQIEPTKRVRWEIGAPQPPTLIDPKLSVLRAFA
jgi:murein DD-endopeptidase MepM/ murein hydrolase activator NlpD